MENNSRGCQPNYKKSEGRRERRDDGSSSPPPIQKWGEKRKCVSSSPTRWCHESRVVSSWRATNNCLLLLLYFVEYHTTRHFMEWNVQRWDSRDPWHPWVEIHPRHNFRTLAKNRRSIIDPRALYSIYLVRIISNHLLSFPFRISNLIIFQKMRLLLQSLSSATTSTRIRRKVVLPFASSHHRSMLTRIPSNTNVPKALCLQKHYPKLIELIHHLKETNDGIIPLLNTKQQDDLVARTKEVVSSSTNKTKEHRQAAVLVLLCSVNEQPSILFTKRAAHLTNHASEMAFVGGHYDEAAGDRSLIETAIREAHEELLPNMFSSLSFADNLEILGECTPLPSLYGTPVTPVIALLWPNLTLPLSDYFPGEPSEVDTVLAVSLQDLLQNETTRKLPANEFRLIDAPVYPTPYGDVWGLTAYIVRPLLRNLFRRAFIMS